MIVTTVNELREAWPMDESGGRSLELVISFLNEKLIATAAYADCNPVSAPGEAAANKAFAQLVRDFRSLRFAVPAGGPPTLLKSLNRFKTEPAKPNDQPTG